jgi:hypothetical protein
MIEDTGQVSHIDGKSIYCCTQEEFSKLAKYVEMEILLMDSIGGEEKVIFKTGSDLRKIVIEKKLGRII